MLLLPFLVWILYILSFLEKVTKYFSRVFRLSAGGLTEVAVCTGAATPGPGEVSGGKLEKALRTLKWYAPWPSKV